MEEPGRVRGLNALAGYTKTYSALAVPEEGNTDVTKPLSNLKKSLKHRRLAPTLALVGVVLVASWMGYTRGLPRGPAGAPSRPASSPPTQPRRSPRSCGRPTGGRMWVGPEFIVHCLLTSWLAASFVSLNASRRWVLAALPLDPRSSRCSLDSSLSPALANSSRMAGCKDRHLLQWGGGVPVGPLWVEVYVAGSRRIPQEQLFTDANRSGGTRSPRQAGEPFLQS